MSEVLVSAPLTYLGNPFRGPTPFQPGDPIFGRERELKLLLNQLLSDRLVLLHSSSGCGKTSLVEAGLKQRLKHTLQIFPPVSLKQTTGVTERRTTLGDRLQSYREQQPVSVPEQPSAEPRCEFKFFFFDQFEEVLAGKDASEEERVEFFRDLGLWALAESDEKTQFRIRKWFDDDLIDTVDLRRLRVRVPANSPAITGAELDLLKNLYLIRDDQPSTGNKSGGVELWNVGRDPAQWNHVNALPRVRIAGPESQNDSHKGCGSRVASLAFVGNGSDMLTVGCPDGTVQVFDLSQLSFGPTARYGFERLQTLRGAIGSVTTQAFDSRTNTLYIAGAGRQIEVWTIPTAQSFRQRRHLAQELDNLEKAAEVQSADALASNVQQVVHNICQALPTSSETNQCEAITAPR